MQQSNYSKTARDNVGGRSTLKFHSFRCRDGGEDEERDDEGVIEKSTNDLQ